MSKIPEPLKSILNDYYHGEWSEEIDALVDDVASDSWVYDASIFKDQLRSSIKNINFSKEDYESVTGEDFDTEEELINKLKDIFIYIFPDDEL